MADSKRAPKNKRRSSSLRRKGGFSLLGWWPLLLGLVATPIAMHFASIVALAGPDALMTLYPYVLLLRGHIPGISRDLSAISQWMIYLEFPLYGLIMTVFLRRRGVLAALGAGIAVHLLGVLAVLVFHHGTAF